MKTVQKGEDIKRVKEAEAESLVKNKGYQYVPKSAYKGIKTPEVKEPSPEVSEAPAETKKKKK